MIGGGIGMLGVSTADVSMIEPVLSASLGSINHSGIIHSVIGFSFAGTFLATVVSLVRNFLRKRKQRYNQLMRMKS